MSRIGLVARQALNACDSLTKIPYPESGGQTLVASSSRLRATKSRLDGDDLRAVFADASSLLEHNVEAINALNVFPVPDGDTGTNMFLTLRDIVRSAEPMEGADAGEVAATMAGAALMGARGNSGVILSQFFKGMAVGLEGASDFGVKELAEAFRSAREHSYKAVGNPVEGTMLTVISSVSVAAQEAFAAGKTVQAACDAVCAAATDSVASTPTMLPVLREAGVVDAGGQGLAVILEGVRRSVNGEDPNPSELTPPAPEGVAAATGRVSMDFVDAVEEEVYGYCTQFLIQGSGMDLDSIRQTMGDLAHSTVIVGDEDMVKVHVHAEAPGPVLSAAVAHGTLAQINIQNMDEQHAGFSQARREETEPVSIAVVAVVQGEGLRRIFEDTGASKIVSGGDTMNPSVQDLLAAIEGAPSDNVVILPNNRNIVPAASQAVELSKKNARVVPSRSVPQGVAALLSLNIERDLDSNVAEMGESLESVRTGEVTTAVRPVTLNSVEVESGGLIGLLEHELVVAGERLPDLVESLLRKADVEDGDLVTLYWGAPIRDDEARETEQHVGAAFPRAEVELVEGAQPHYHFIISVE